MTAAPTLITAIFERGRSPLAQPLQNDTDQVRRQLPAIMSIDCPMVIYTDRAHLDLVRTLRAERPTRIIEVDMAVLLNHPPYQPIDAIRRDPAWLAQADWLPGSPQAAVTGHVQLAPSKMIWLREQSAHNPFGSSRFYWIDAGLGDAVPAELLDARSIHRLGAYHRRFLHICQPREAPGEVEGFAAGELAKLAGVERTRWVVLGGFFGGDAAHIEAVATAYAGDVERTLATGLMGSETPLFTLATYARPGLFDLAFVGSDGRLAPFFSALAAGLSGDSIAAELLLPVLTETWFFSFNAPGQLRELLESILETEPRLLQTGRRVLVNNSTRADQLPEYTALCAQYGLEELRANNPERHPGRDGARIAAAEIFYAGGRHAMFWFEDDMRLVAESDPRKTCASGFVRHVHRLASVAMAIQQREQADYLKLSFSEASGAHHTQQAWHHLGAQARAHYFPGTIEAPPLVTESTRSIDHLSYAIAEACYSRWPQLVTRRGTAKLFFEERTATPDEQYWAARSFELERMGQLRAGVLLASPVDHRRAASDNRMDHHEIRARDAMPSTTPTLHKPPFANTALGGTATGHRKWPSTPPRPDAPGTPERIFVSIANYRDSETPHTLRDLFAKASRPERIIVGVFSQVVPGEDDDCLPPPDVPAGQIRELRCHPADSMGACWARSRILTELLGEEEYVLQIDSHSRFEPGWDDRLIVMLLACPTPRAVLSSYPNAYTPPETLHAPSISTIAAEKFNEVGVLGLRARGLHTGAIPPAPQPGAYISAGCLFASAAALREVPYDPYLYFNGEEFSIAVRLWTHGWDIYGLNLPVMYHDYENKRGRHRHWDDHQDWPELDRRCYARLRHLFGIEQCDDPLVLREIDRYALGTQRTLAEYEEYVDVSFATMHTGPRATYGYFPPPMTEGARRRLRRARADYLKPGATPDQVFASEVRNGVLSDLTFTQNLRTGLGAWLRNTGVKRLVDAGSGLFHWMAHTDLDMLESYIGCDILPEIIDANQRLHGSRRRVLFALKDVVSDPLPACDAILCRDLLTRLPVEDGLAAIGNFRASGARWLIASTAPESDLPGISADGCLDNLSAEPAGLGKPAVLLDDVAGLPLGVWALKN